MWTGLPPPPRGLSGSYSITSVQWDTHRKVLLPFPPPPGVSSQQREGEETKYISQRCSEPLSSSQWWLFTPWREKPSKEWGFFWHVAKLKQNLKRWYQTACVHGCSFANAVKLSNTRGLTCKKMWRIVLWKKQASFCSSLSDSVTHTGTAVFWAEVLCDCCKQKTFHPAWFTGAR